MKFHEEIASNYYMIASIYTEREEFTDALDYAMKALEEDRKVENSLGIAKDFQALGIILLKSGKEEEAYFTLFREIKICLNYIIPLSEKLDTEEKAKEYKKMNDSLK